MCAAPTTPCAGGCGKLLYRSATSAPNPVCLGCRAAAREPHARCSLCSGRMSEGAIGKRRAGVSKGARPPVCGTCREQRRQAAELTCEGPCGRVRPRSEFRPDRSGYVVNRVCRQCEWQSRTLSPATRKARLEQTRVRRRARKGGGRTYDGVTDEAIWERDRWTCLMPRCLQPGGRAIDPAAAWPDPWSPSIDHIQPLAQGGPDNAPNKRAAHLRCNASAGRAVRRRETSPAASSPAVGRSAPEPDHRRTEL